jgi:hypothetical protein
MFSLFASLVLLKPMFVVSQSDKLVQYILAHAYGGNWPSKSYALSKSGANLVLQYDVY